MAASQNRPWVRPLRARCWGVARGCMVRGSWSVVLGLGPNVRPRNPDPVRRYVRLSLRGVVEALTKGEATVLLSLLGADWSETERSRIRASRIPRSTYQEAKRRLYREGYLKNRYVPDPHALGMQGFRFRVARPFVDEMNSVASALADDPHTVTLWVGQTALFVVQVVAEANGTRPVGELPQGEISGTVVDLTTTHPAEEIPIFFDAEGAWSRVAGTPGPRRYPRGVPCPRGRGDEIHARLTPRTALALRELLARPFDASIEARNVATVAAPFLPRSQRQVLAQGWAAWRVLLSFSKTLAHEGRELRQVILVAANLKTGLRLDDLTGFLARQTGASPFLAATDGSHVLLASFGGVGARGGPAPGPSVLGSLRAAVNDLQIVREDLETLETRIDLRFDRLPPKPTLGSSR